MNVQAVPAISKNAAFPGGEGAKHVVSTSFSNEIVFAVVGHVGSGTSEVAEVIKATLEREDQRGGPFEAFIVKASDVIRAAHGSRTSGALSGITEAIRLQDAGDEIRLSSQDNSQIAKSLVARVREIRANAQGDELVVGDPIVPNGVKRAYVLDSLRHPDEVKLLKAIYQEAFILVGVVCDPKVRRERLVKKYEDANSRQIDDFMARDADGLLANGQKVADTFFMSDFFVDNTQPRFLGTGGVQKPNPMWRIAEDLGRLAEMVTHEKIVRPTMAETAMYHAHGSRMRSSCLSRQVGAALVDSSGEIIATGCNEAPVAGGGVYTGEGEDFRCAFHHGYCSSVREQNRIIDELISIFPGLQEDGVEGARAKLRKSPIGQLLEFSRAVHAEMDALLAASRKGISTVGTKLFVTTYPCHYCARHIVAAGVDEVQYIEPYPKSLATSLHDDAITSEANLVAPSVAKLKNRIGSEDQIPLRVHFRPFTGVAPKLYRRVFIKEQSLKDKDTGEMRISDPEWGKSIAIKKLSYVELEAKLSNA